MKISIVIPNYNGANLLPNCLKSLIATAKPNNLTTEYILVDNGSSDKSLTVFNRLCQKHHLRFKSIPLKKNLGFGAAVNRGVASSSYPLVLILNNDTQIAPNFFHQLNQNFDSRYLCHCFTILNGRTVESQGIDFDYSGKCLQLNHDLNPTTLIRCPPRQVWGASGAATIYNKNTFIKIGGFDESFFNYIEDVDLSFRFHRHNFKTRLIPSCLVYHLGGITSNQIPHLRAKYTCINWVRLIIKNYSIIEILQNLPGILVERLRNLSYLVRIHFSC